MRSKANRKNQRRNESFSQTIKPYVALNPPTEPYASFTEAASENDRVWFENNPGEDQRIRDYMAGEFREQVPPTDYKVIVHQVKPGCRVRFLASPEMVEMANHQGIWVTNPVEMAIREVQA